MTDVKPPANLKGVTPEWLTSFLHSLSLLSPSSSVTQIEKSIVEGGFNSTVSRLKVTYSESSSSSSSPPLPSSFIIKFGTARGSDTSNDKELYFYQNVDKIGIPSPLRAPKVYLAVKSGRTFVFLLEDLGNLQHHPQKEGGADYETAKKVVFALANFHAKFWNSSPDAFSKIVENLCPLADQEKYYQALQGYVEMAVGDFDDLTNDDPELQKISKFVASNFSDLVREARKSPCTLLHGDARLSNYFFENEKGVVAVDWQGFNVGSGPGELAYFLSMSVKPEILRKHEDEFLHLYYDTLVNTGSVKTEEFPFSAFFQKYVVGLATSGTVPLLTARGVIEGRKFINNPPSNPGIAEHAKLQIAMHDNIKPMIDAWCASARHHPLARIQLNK